MSTSDKAEKTKRDGKAQRRRGVAISAVLQCATLADAAKQCGFSLSTLYRLLAEPTFQAELDAERQRLMRQLNDSLLANSHKGVAVMVAMASSPATGDSARATVATKLVELTMRAGIIDAMQRRIEQLEADLRKQQDGGINVIAESFTTVGTVSEAEPFSSLDYPYSNENSSGEQRESVDVLQPGSVGPAQPGKWSRTFGTELDPKPEPSFQPSKVPLLIS